MPHVARIASSVYDGICPGGKMANHSVPSKWIRFFCADPICRAFSFDPRGQGSPHPSVQKSLLFNLVMHNRHKGEQKITDSIMFKLAFRCQAG